MTNSQISETDSGFDQIEVAIALAEERCKLTRGDDELLDLFTRSAEIRVRLAERLSGDIPNDVLKASLLALNVYHMEQSRRKHQAAQCEIAQNGGKA